MAHGEPSNLARRVGGAASILFGGCELARPANPHHEHGKAVPYWDLKQRDATYSMDCRRKLMLQTPFGERHHIQYYHTAGHAKDRLLPPLSDEVRRTRSRRGETLSTLASSSPQAWLRSVAHTARGLRSTFAARSPVAPELASKAHLFFLQRCHQAELL